jgi:hypothetical protein
MRFCVDCRSFGPDDKACSAILDPVMGEKTFRSCATERFDLQGQCGPDAKLFKQRGEAGVDPRKVHGEPPSLNIAGGNRRDLKRGRSDDDGPQRAEGGA